MIPPGTRVGNLVIGALLGRGGMGEVYAAEQISLKRPVAVKRIADHLADTPDAIRRFEREAQVVARIRSENVVGIYELGTFADETGNNHVLLVMELVDGGLSLKRLLSTPLLWAQATSLIRQAAEGLIAAADHHIIHRDIKPDNILLTRRGVAKITDFGLAKALDSTAMTLGGSIMGTPAYMAPEVCRGQPADARSDLYSLGATWFHLLTGRTPFTSETTLGMLRAHIEEAVPDLRSLTADVPPAVAALVARLLAKDPAARPTSASDLANAIDELGVPVPRTVPELAARFASPAEALTLMPTPMTKVPGSAPTVVATPSANAPTVVTPTATPAPQQMRATRHLPLMLGMVVVAIAAAAGGAWFASRGVSVQPSPASPVVTPRPATPTPVIKPSPVVVPAPVIVTVPRPAPTVISKPTVTAPPPVIDAPRPITPDPPPIIVQKPPVIPVSEPPPPVTPVAARPLPPVVTPIAPTPPSPPTTVAKPVPAPATAPTPVVPATSPEGLLLQLDGALSERRFGDVQRLADVLDQRDLFSDQKDEATDRWKAEEDRLWTELDRIEELADKRDWQAALTALNAVPADPVHATKEVVVRHAELSTTIRKNANTALDKAIRYSDDLVKRGKPDLARTELQTVRPAATAVGRTADLDRALAHISAPP